MFICRKCDKSDWLWVCWRSQVNVIVGGRLWPLLEDKQAWGKPNPFHLRDSHSGTQPILSVTLSPDNMRQQNWGIGPKLLRLMTKHIYLEKTHLNRAPEIKAVISNSRSNDKLDLTDKNPSHTWWKSHHGCELLFQYTVRCAQSIMWHER